MKNLIIASILLAFSCATPSFSQPEKPQFPQNGLTPNHAVDSRNILTKRLRGESGFRISQSGNLPAYVDSIQYLYSENNWVSEKRNRSFVNGNWVLQSRILRTQGLTFDSSGITVMEILQTTSDNGISWELSQRTNSSYSPSGQLASLSMQQWDASSGTWGDYHSYDYDEQGNIEFESDNGIFHFYYNHYNQDGFLETIANDIYVNSWVVHLWRRHFHYDPAHPGQLIASYTEDYADWDDTFADSTIYTYDQAGNLSIKDYFKPGFFWGECSEIYRQKQFFDNQHRCIRQEDFKACYVVDSTLSWQLSSAADYFYDADGDPMYWSKHDYSGSDTTILIHRYTYETVSQVQQALPPIQFALYPNPASGTIFLETAPGSAQWANIFDTQGRQWCSQKLKGYETEVLRLEGIPSGTYLLQVIGNDGKMTAKPFVIAH